MHVTKRDGMRTVTLTEQEYSVIYDAFGILNKLLERNDEVYKNTTVFHADMILMEALEVIALDDSDLLDEHGDYDPTRLNRKGAP